MPYNSGPFNVISRSTVSYLQIYPSIEERYFETEVEHINVYSFFSLEGIKTF